MDIGLRFISDEGHGWLEVPKAMLKNAGCEQDISSFSYEKDEAVYLEEDCDAGTFILAMRNKYPSVNIIFDEVFQSRTPIRGYKRFIAEGV
jgi:hypothetical protein